jgi:predicted regulator of Ras-like GTPase activity (Roadblock/LC7/MglB family)
MSKIQDVLTDLKSLLGVKGTALVTPEGLMIASALGTQLESDVVAGLASFLITTIRRSLHEGQVGQFRRCILNSTHGKVVLVDLGESFLFVATDQFANLEALLQEVQDACRKIKRLSQMTA